MPKQLQFRSIHPDDIPALHAIMSHPRAAENSLHLYTTEYSDTEENFRKSKPGVYVHPDYWNQGIGSRLMEAILDIADNWLDLKRVELEVNTDNPPAVHLYQKFGFEIEGTHKFHSYGNGRWPDSYFMGRVR